MHSRILCDGWHIWLPLFVKTKSWLGKFAQHNSKSHATIVFSSKRRTIFPFKHEKITHFVFTSENKMAANARTRTLFVATTLTIPYFITFTLGFMTYRIIIVLLTKRYNKRDRKTTKQVKIRKISKNSLFSKFKFQVQSKSTYRGIIFLLKLQKPSEKSRSTIFCTKRRTIQKHKQNSKNKTARKNQQVKTQVHRNWKSRLLWLRDESGQRRRWRLRWSTC